MNVLLCGEFDDVEFDDWRAALSAAVPEVHWLGRASALALADSVHVAVVANPPPGSLQGLPKLEWVQSLWAGVDRLLADATIPRALPILRMVDPLMTAAMAETALWAVIALQRGFFAYRRQQLGALWLQHPQRRAQDVPVLVLGAGVMGGAVAQALVQQGFPVSTWSRRAGDLKLWESLPRAQVLINLLPLTDDTRGILGARLFAALPRGAAVVNLARGGHVVEADLLAALETGQIGDAVLDVFATEPLPREHPFWSHPRVTVLPHVAAQNDKASAAAVVAANLLAWRQGRPLLHRVERSRGY